MTQAKVLGEKRVPHLTCPRIQGMAGNARLHPNRTDLLSKMVVGIAENVLRHVVRQGVVRLIVNRNIHHRDAPRKVVCYDRRYKLFSRRAMHPLALASASV